MKFKEFIQLQENSLYTDSTTKDALMKDKERLMDSLMFNFFGFLGLYKLSDSRGYMKTYETTEGKLIINSIDDTNHDVSLSIKMAYDAGLIMQSVVNKMTRLLALIKQRKVRSKDLDETQIRAFLDEIHYASHKPSSKVFLVMQAFHNGVLDLPNLAKELYKLAKMREYQDITGEFRGLVMKGQYIDFFSKLKSSNQSPSTSNITSANNDNDEVKSGDTTMSKLPSDSTTSQQTVVKLGQTNEFMDAIFNATNQKQFNDFFKTYGVSEKTFNFSKFKEWLLSKKKSKRPQVSLMSWPLYNWLTNNSFPDDKTVRRVINNITLNYFRSFAESGEINEFINDLEKIDFAKIKKFFDPFYDTAFNAVISDLTTLFVKNVISRVSDFSDSTFNRIKHSYDLIREFAKNVDALLSTTIQDTSLYNEFNGVSAILLALRMVSEYSFTVSDSDSGKIKISDFFAKAFGYDCLSDNELPLFKIKKSCFDKATPEIQSAFKLLVRKSIKGAEIVEEENELWRKWITHWSTKLLAIWDTAVVNEINKYNEIDVTKLTEKDIDRAYNFLIKRNDIDSISGVFKYVNVKELNSNGIAYYDNAMKIIIRLMKAGKIHDDFALLRYAVMRKSQLDAITRWMENNNSSLKFVQDTLLDFIYGNENYYEGELVKELCEWFVGLVKKGKVKISGKMVIALYSRFKDIEYVLPSDPSENEKILNFPGLDDYLRWLVKNDENLRRKIIEFNEKTLNVTHSGMSTLVGGSQIPYPVKYLSDEYITDGIIENFKKIWINLGAKRLEDVENYSFSKKLTDAYNEIMSKALDDPNYVTFVFKALNNSTPEKVSDYFGKKDVPEILKILDDDRTYEAEVAKFINMISNNDEFAKKITTSSISNFSQAISQEFSNNKKKFNKAIRESITKDFCEFLQKMHEIGRETDIETIYATLGSDFKKGVVDYFNQRSFLKQVSKTIFDDKNPIKPYGELDDERISTILQYNSIALPNINLRDAPTFKALVSRVNMALGALEDLKVEQVESTSEEMERKSVEYDVFNKYRHGNIAVKFLREFNVNIPKQIEGQAKFLKEFPNTEKIDPAFHGTGSVAASMILRYGFAIISAGDPSVVGRMLGNGIYFSNVLDKVSQYVTDGGYTRGKGTKGYIFQMNALLGRKSLEYEVAGIDGTDGIKSPEWCVFKPNEQLRIYKAFEVEIISKKDMDTLKAKHGINENTAVKILSFKEFLREAMTPGMQTTTYTFVDGTIPISENQAVDFEEFKPEQFGPHVRLEPSQNGPMVVIEHDGEESEAFCVRYTHLFMTDYDELRKFLNLLRKFNS